MHPEHREALAIWDQGDQCRLINGVWAVIFFKFFLNFFVQASKGGLGAGGLIFKVKEGLELFRSLNLND